MSTPQFSVIIPTYNREQCIVQTLQSVQAQTFSDWEVIVVDDGSTDKTKQRVQECSKNDSRIRVVFQTNAGPSAARNRGMDEATGEIVVYLDSDDYARSEWLQTIHDAWTQYPNAMFGVTNHQRQKILIDDEGNISKKLPAEIAFPTTGVALQDFYHWKFHTTSSVLFHTRDCRQQVRWDEQLPLFEDWDLLMQLGNHFPDGFLYIPEVLIEYSERYGGNGLCSNASYADWANGFELIYQKHKGDHLLVGQEWYPQRVEKYKKLQAEFETGEGPSPQSRHFV